MAWSDIKRSNFLRKRQRRRSLQAPKVAAPAGTLDQQRRTIQVRNAPSRRRWDGNDEGATWVSPALSMTRVVWWWTQGRIDQAAAPGSAGKCSADTISHRVGTGWAQAPIGPDNGRHLCPGLVPPGLYAQMGPSVG